MQNEMYINGALRQAILEGSTVVAHKWAGNRWFVLCRNTPVQAHDKDGAQFTEYTSDEMEQFEVSRTTSGSLPTVLKYFDITVKRRVGEIL